jgi:hypothetical protein
MEAVRSTGPKLVLGVLPDFRCKDLFSNEAARRTSRWLELGVLLDYGCNDPFFTSCM